MTNYQMIRSLESLPPATIKTFKITSTLARFDFIKQFNGLCVAYKIHNHTGGSFTYRINDSADAIDLKSLEEGVNNVHIESIEIIGATDADLIVKIMPIPLLKRFGALEVG